MTDVLTSNEDVIVEVSQPTIPPYVPPPKIGLVEINQVVQRGTAWLTGSGAPTAPGGQYGDMYLDVDTGNIYQWDGTTWQLEGTFAPATDTPQEVLDKLLTVDGAGSALDADLLDGQHGAFYAKASDLTGYAPITSPTFLGDPQVPMQLPTDSDNSIASTGWVSTKVGNYVLKAGDTMTGQLTFRPTLDANIDLGKGASGRANQIIARTGTSMRWNMILGNTTAESGGNVGSGFELWRYDDSGVSLGAAFTIARATGNPTFSCPAIQQNGPAAANAQINISKAASGFNSMIYGQMAGSARWLLQLGDSSSETGSNAGSNFGLTRYSDAGASLGQPITINRASGDMTLSLGTVQHNSSSSASYILNKTGTSNCTIVGRVGNLNRWQLKLGDATAESGSNAGSNFTLDNYNDAGTILQTGVLAFNRASGLGTVLADPTANLGIATKQYVDTKAGAGLTDAPADGLVYGRKNNAWSTIVGGSIISDTAPTGTLQSGQTWWESDTGNLYIYYNDGDSSQWVMIAAGNPAMPPVAADLDMKGYNVINAGNVSSNAITFPATQVSSSNPNVLDDYEEGTWGLVVTPGSGAFANLTVTTASYVKVGRMVNIQAHINIIAVGTAATSIVMNLPFPCTTPQLVCHGREVQATGKSLNGQASGAGLSISYYDNTLPLANNLQLVISATYFTST